jgi:hypothetical protein
METTQPAGTPVPRTPGDPGIARQGVPVQSPKVRVSSPDDVLAVVPHLLGFHPALSFVVLGAGPPLEHVELGFRYDLPNPPDPVATAQIVEHAAAVLASRGTTTVIAVGYGPGRLVTPVADLFASTIRRRGLRLRELLRAEEGRYWSYLCRNVHCCPAEGVPFDYQSHPAAAAMTAAGMAAYPDRNARASVIAPLTGAAAAAMDAAIGRACNRAAALIEGARALGRRDPLRPVTDEGRRAVREAIGVYRGGGRITDHDQLAWLMVALAGLPVRDDAWARMVPGHRDAHLALWGDIVRHATGEWSAAPASLLAFTAWQSGDGTLANIALDRALAADPGYSMALLLRDILDAGVPPSAARLPMTPEEVADSYERAARAASSPRGRRGGGGRAGRGRRPRPRPPRETGQPGSRENGIDPAS